VFGSSSFSLLSAAIGAQFGSAQTDVAKGASIVLILQMIGYPVVGVSLDRFGSRRVAAASIALFAISLLILSSISNALWQFYLAFVLIGLFASGTNVVSYARAITLWCDCKRGLTLGGREFPGARRICDADHYSGNHRNLWLATRDHGACSL
jgi:MFS family permease